MDTPPTEIHITPATFPDDLSTVQQLFTAYTSTLDLDLTPQNYAAEFAGLPGAYSAPRGVLLLARTPTAVLGCVAARPLPQPGACEMKRLWVDEEGRGSGVGRRLVEAVVAWARAGGYAVVKLDTLAGMARARGLYERCGFRACGPYGGDTVPGVVFMELELGVCGKEEEGRGDGDGLGRVG